jgi:ADP-ribose pyrophosphatase YjhB (NUDIX family)
MKKICFFIVAALLTTACQESLENRCEREAREYTEKHCPTPVGKNIVLDSMTFDKKTHTIQYAYTLSGEIDDSTIVNNSKPRELLLQEVRNSTNLKLYKEAGYSFTYTYYSAKNKGTQLFKATFRKSDYQ